MVRPRGLEPPPLAGQRPQHCASTSSAMTAYKNIYNKHTIHYKEKYEDIFPLNIKNKSYFINFIFLEMFLSFLIAVFFL